MFFMNSDICSKPRLKGPPLDMQLLYCLVTNLWSSQFNSILCCPYFSSATPFLFKNNTVTKHELDLGKTTDQ
ncbi:hypothetical protein ATANTOWER_026858 [Ataeniobius toweri]|uniref:Uncharacterized protein n=1 Tax=Ataeniobius toweri TaxID=208326 RepID=A0ABU7BUW2_9TELE|nr:hypothetical protein [Ataeniobius toweri]